MPSQPLSKAELTTILQQVTAQMASDHTWFVQVTDDLTDHAGRLDKLGLNFLTNKTDQERMTEESKKAFALIETNDGLSEAS